MTIKPPPKLLLYVVRGRTFDKAWLVAANFDADAAQECADKCKKQLEVFEDITAPIDSHIRPGTVRSEVKYFISQVEVQQDAPSINALAVWMDTALEACDTGAPQQWSKPLPTTRDLQFDSAAQQHMYWDYVKQRWSGGSK